MKYEDIKKQAKEACVELVETARMQAGDILIVGCSSSEVVGLHIGKGSDINAAQAIYEGIMEVLRPRGIFIAAQCCEHLNRAVVTERKAVECKDDIVNVVPHPHAGGSFATTVYEKAEDPVVVEKITADAGMDIGRTLIGMHLRRVAVPVRLKTEKIGEAILIAARTRPRFIGGERAKYDKALAGGEIQR